jgi:hypothetical protein
MEKLSKKIQNPCVQLDKEIMYEYSTIYAYNTCRVYIAASSRKNSDRKLVMLKLSFQRTDCL